MNETLRHTFAVTALAVLLSLLPLALVEVAPLTDLPQQTAQVRLFAEALDTPDGPYQVQWLAPNKLAYVAFAFGWWWGGPLAAGRLGVMLIAVAWALALVALARAHRRPLASVLVAQIFFFSHVLYWGLVHFLVGLPIFIFWWIGVEALRHDARRLPRWRMARLALLTLLLYWAHILWLASGLVTLGVHALVTRWSSRRMVQGLLACAPTLALVAAWYPSLIRGGFESVTAWGGSPLFRLHPGWWINSALGGLQGSLESTLLGLVIAWYGLGLWQHRGALWTRTEGAIDRRLLTVGLGFLLAALVLPNVLQRTVFFASRWLPASAVFLVLALPMPRLRPVLRSALAALLLAGLTTTTAITWQAFEEEELEGLATAVAALPSGSRTLGLDFVRTSPRIQGFPFYHLYVLGQVVHGGEVARSFANEASSLVVYRDLPRHFPWTEGLDWRAHKVRRSDIDHFDHVMVQGPPETLGPLLADPRLVPLTPPARWVLFEVRPAAASDPSNAGVKP